MANHNSIQNEADYRAALLEIEGLMSAEKETSEGDRLDALLILVQAYEEEHYAMDMLASSDQDAAKDVLLARLKEQLPSGETWDRDTLYEAGLPEKSEKTWNYRIVHHHQPEEWFGLHEVFYTGGRPTAMTVNQVTFACDGEEGPEGIIQALKMALADATGRPVLDEAEIPGAAKE